MQSEKFAEFLGVFADVAREGSFSGAGRRRGRTPSSIGRQIDMLEAYLDTPLFLRSTRLLTLTDAGEALLVRARQILDSLEDAQQELASMKGAVTGILRVACFPTFGKRYVLPVMGELARRYPDVRLELDLTERIADPVAERLDLVIRIGDMADSTLIGARIATQTRILCASPAYIAQAGMPARLDQLAAHRLIDKLHGADLLGWADVLGQPARAASAQPVFACDDFEAMRLAALEGLGIGYLPDWVVGPDVKEGQLLQLFPEWSAQARASTGIHALRALRQPPARVTVFLDALRGLIGHPPTWAPGGQEHSGETWPE
ncbi:LysR substrate-binding domain-containing protein [Herbaspirillum sp. WKF16]|uniref:LysR family transcriptional regulator n=1 Tax=Herbaspirillum sp. WKF16 TaxID=3028312 RepID=UPI0023A962A4|nr:LysR family transcriptional regulator [Herbaspirillum sp. WKF16]WDZ97223.1 LysR substrate-binding domain-containing protein [Herbaspirillum sp. WKF16]